MKVYKLFRINFIIGILLSATTGTLAQSGAGLFDAPWRGFDTGTLTANNVFSPATFAVGDIDGDGDTDAVVGNRLQSRPGLSVLKNHGYGTYAQPVIYQLPFDNSVGGVALADFDADGDLDVIATIPGGNTTLAKIAVWRNDGDGSLAARTEFPTGDTAPMGVVAADFTGDGFVDIATANYISESVSLLRHNGLTGASAAYLAPVSIAVIGDSETFNNVLQIAAADLNGDGRLDLAVGHITREFVGFDPYPVNTHSILLNTGNGSFSAPTAYTAVTSRRAFAPSTVALADLNNDGKTDLIGASAREISFGTFQNVASVRYGNGNGTFGSPASFDIPRGAGSPNQIVAADLSGDNFREIIAATPTGRSGDGYAVLINDGTGNFPQSSFYEASQQTVATATADTDRDGDNDVLTIANSSAVVTVHRNPGNGIFRVLPRSSTIGLAEAIECADIDSDGDIDVVASEFFAHILKNNGDGTFAPVINYSPPRDFADMKLRDLNGDGKPDLLFGPDRESPPYHFGYALNNGDGTFATGVVVNVGACGEGSIDAFDMDADGDLDVALTEEQGCAGANPPRIFIFRNDGAANFTRMTDIAVPTFPVGIAGADVTGDGKVDLITSLSPGGIGVLPGNGNLTFGAPVTSSTRPFKFKLADFNRDGKLDVGMILYQNAAGTLQVGTALGNGNGTFQTVQTRTGASVLENLRISNDVDAADVNGDQRPDLIVTNAVSNDISIFLSNENGSLQPHERYGAGYSSHYSTVNDFTGDGKPDIATTIGLLTGVAETAVVVLRNISANAVRKTAFDFDGDGKSDISIFRPSNGQWWISRSSSNVFAVEFGSAADKITPADFTGDGKTDLAFFRSSSGEWFVLRSEDNSFYSFPFGSSGDVPVAGDFDGDGKADAAVFRPSNATWYIQKSMGGVRIETFGLNGDVPVTGDYDGDGKSDIAIYRPSNGQWWINRSTGGITAVEFGTSADKPVSADYTGDGKADIAFWRESTGEWFIMRSEDNSFYAFQFGSPGDKAIPADYDGDGKMDAAVFRPSNNVWYLLQSRSGFGAVTFGASGDIPTPTAFR